MKRRFLVLLFAVLLPLTARAAGLAGLLALPAEPDPAETLDQEPALYRLAFFEQGRQKFDAYAFSMPGDPTAFLDAYGALCAESGYTVEEDVFDGQYLCYRIAQGDRTGGMFVMDYEGKMLFLSLREMNYRPLPTPAPEPTDAPESPLDALRRLVDRKTAAPTGQPSSPESGGRWEWQTQTVSCPECHGSGRCSLCHGTGTYRIYGQAVSCSAACSFCGGTGSYQTRQYVYIP